MSNILKHITLLISFLTISSYGFCQWEKVSTMISGNDTLDIQDIYFFDEDEGLVFCSKTTTNPNHLWGYVMKTMDGGVSWDTLRKMQDTVPVSIQFTSEFIGHMLCKNPQHTEVRTFHTSDAGLNWTAKSLIINANPPYQDIKFYNDTIGVYSTAGFSAITYDGGQSWNSILTNPHDGAPFISLEDDVFMGVGGALLIYSEDTCQNFVVDTISWGGSANNVTFHQNHFYISISGNNGYNLGYPYFNFGVLVKKELGSDVIKTYHFPEFRTNFITSKNEEIYVGTTDLIGNERHILKSEDEGLTWWSQEIINLNGDAWLGMRKIQCLSNDTCFASDGYSIYKTTNGGGPLVEQVGHEVFLGTDEDSKQTNGLSIYPNPTSKQINIYTDKVIKEANIFDTKGQLVYSENLNSKSAVIQMQNFGKGVYFVQIITTHELINRKIIKQ